MIKILLSGCNGRMGCAVINSCSKTPLCSVIAGVDVMGDSHKNDFPVFTSIDEYVGKCDVIVDFSHHTATAGLLNYGIKKNIPVVIATTGHTIEETNLINEASKVIPIFYSRNMSLGINLLIALAKKAYLTLGNSYDIEIIEKHHNQKLDAPSGTALMIADALKNLKGVDTEYVYDRHTTRKVRNESEIGIHAIRGGTIVGEHDVLFAGNDENITISHSASSRNVFAEGAVRAALFIADKPAGLYNMDDIVNTLLN